jgi:hypothetical protein
MPTVSIVMPIVDLTISAVGIATARLEQVYSKVVLACAMFSQTNATVAQVSAQVSRNLRGSRKGSHYVPKSCLNSRT